MPAEWPISALAARELAKQASFALRGEGERPIAAIVHDFFNPPRARLTDQERSLMSAMLHGLIERIAVELRALLSAQAAEECAATSAELIADLTRAGLIQDEALVELLLRRADIQRLGAAGRIGRTTLQHWTASGQADVAAAAMSVVTARGRSRDRFGRVTLHLSDLPAGLACDLTAAVSAALGLRLSRPSDREMGEAMTALLASREELQPTERVETQLAEALGSEGRQAPDLLRALADEGDAPLLAAILAAEASIPADAAWSLLLGGPDRLALLLRLADVPRAEAAAMIAASGSLLGDGGPSTLR